MTEKIGLEAVFGTQAFSQGLKTYTGGITKATGQTENAAASMGKSLITSLAAAAAGYITLSAAVGIAKDSIAAAAEEETNLSSLNATIKSMGLSSQISGEKIRSMTEAMQTANGVFAHDDLERAAQSFLKIENFNPASLQSVLKVVQDFAAGTGQSAESAAQAIATALETGQTKSLHFSAALRTQIQDMITAGDQAGALALIMDTLNSKYGGQAAAAMDTYNGKLLILKNNWGELLATMGGEGLPAGKGLFAMLNNAVIAETQLLGIQQKLTREDWNTLTPVEKMAMLFAPGGAFTGIRALVGLLTQNLPKVSNDIKEIGKVADEAFSTLARGGQDAAEAWIAARKGLEFVPDAAEKAAQAQRKLTEETLALKQAEEDLQKTITDRTSWETMYTSAKSATDRADIGIQWLGQQLQGLGSEGSLVWEGFLTASGKISGPAIEQFIKIQQVFEHIKALMEQGVAVDIIVKWATGEIDKINAAAESALTHGDYVYMGTRNGPGTGSAWLSPTQGWHFGDPANGDTGWFRGGFMAPGQSGIVGDYPGMTTGFEELIHALPGGGVQIYPHSRTPVPGGGASKTTTNNITVNNPTAEPASTSVDMTLRRLNYLGVS